MLKKELSSFIHKHHSQHGLNPLTQALCIHSVASVTQGRAGQAAQEDMERPAVSLQQSLPS